MDSYYSKHTNKPHHNRNSGRPFRRNHTKAQVESFFTSVRYRFTSRILRTNRGKQGRHHKYVCSLSKLYVDAFWLAPTNLQALLSSLLLLLLSLRYCIGCLRLSLLSTGRNIPIFNVVFSHQLFTSERS